MKAYEGPDVVLTAQHYTDAIMVQNASNLSGVINTFNRVLAEIWKEPGPRNQGTDWVNQHPICMLYATQICHLTGMGMVANGPGYGDAYNYCQTRS